MGATGLHWVLGQRDRCIIDRIKCIFCSYPGTELFVFLALSFAMTVRKPSERITFFDDNRRTLLDRCYVEQRCVIATIGPTCQATVAFSSHKTTHPQPKLSYSKAMDQNPMYVKI